MKKKINIKKFGIFLRAGNVESGPPLSTVLGNYGVNTANFCKDFNEKTRLLPNYFLIEVVIYINSDRTYNFIVKELSIAFILKLLVDNSPIFVKGQGGFKVNFLKTIAIRDIYLVSLLKFNSIDIMSIKMVFAIVISSHFYIRDE